MPQDNKIYRQAMLDRLASPEQLHTLMKVTDARGWLALAACAVLLATGLTWGVLGRVPTKLHASGILIHSAGLADVVAVSSGQISVLEVDVGDHVKQGQVIARLAQPELQKEIEGLRAQVAQLEAGFAKSKQLGTQDVQMRSAVSAQERASLRSSIDAADQRKAELGERLSAQEKLLEKGLVTSDTVSATRQQLRASESAMAEMRAQMSRTSADSFSAKRYNEASLQGDELRIQETVRQIKLLEERLAQSSAVISTHAGRVVEVRVSAGDVLAPGAPIASLERTSETGGLEAVLYVDSRVGKRVKPGMEVQLSPTTVPREKHGVLVATVRSVEDFPSTRRGMMRVLRNEQLVETFLTETAGAPIAVRAELRPDASTPTHYRWSSGKGPTTELSSGTRCGAEITTRSERPVALVLPMFESEG